MNISARYNRLWIKFFENLRNRDLRESTEVMCDLRINDDFYFVYLIVMGNPIFATVQHQTQLTEIDKLFKT